MIFLFSSHLCLCTVPSHLQIISPACCIDVLHIVNITRPQGGIGPGNLSPLDAKTSGMRPAHSSL
ncbi:hypothetical protein V1504DRAFT_490413 [Lipomyces starkeyi]